jgi:PKD repeat protein
VNFDGSGSSDPDGDTLTYDWNFGDGSAHGTGAKPPTHTYTNPGTYTATVTVSDGRGGSDTDSVQVTATNTAPVPSIDTPTDGSKYRDGTAVSVTGSSTDAQQGSSLPASAYAWKVRLVHGAHEHVLVDTSGVKSLQFTPPTTHDADAHVVIDLTVTDGQGASGSASRQLQPETVLLRLRSNPAGAPLSYAGAVASDITAAIGFSTTVSAPATFSSGGVQRAFVGWSSGATRVHTLSVPATETTLTATYNAAPVAAASALPTSGAAPLQVDFDGSGSSDPDADTLSYDWNFGDGSAHGTGAKPPTHTYTSPGTYTATVTASDGRGGSDTDTVQVTATNTAPVPSIDTPTAGSQYRDGTAVSVTGSSTDAQQGSSLPASAYAWKVRLVHGAHEHVLVDTSGVKSLQFTPPTTHDADAHIVIDLTVTDAQGTTGTASRQLQPETVLLHLRSNPPGAPLTFAGAAVTTPWDTAATIGFSASLSAPTTFIYGGVQREFVSWSTGAPRVHSLTVPDADTTLTATYNARPAAVATASGTTATVDEELEFDGSGSSDADGDALTYTWDFGDGSAPVEEPATPHTFAAPGDYDVTLTVTDDAGATDANTVRVTVKPPVVEPPPAEPPPGGPPPDPTPPIDVTGPVFRPWRPAPHPRLIAGLVRDPAGVRSVQVALARIAAGRCRWATGAAARLARTRSCSPRHWLEAKLTGRRWELALPNGLPPGRYRLWLLAVDANGNVGRQTAEGQGQLRFRVSRAAAGPACDAPVLRRPLGCGVMAP